MSSSGLRGRMHQILMMLMRTTNAEIQHFAAITYDTLLYAGLHVL